MHQVESVQYELDYYNDASHGMDSSSPLSWNNERIYWINVKFIILYLDII